MREIAISEDELNRRITAVERLTKLYSAERKVHLFATSASIIILLGAAIMMLYRGQAGLTEIGSLLELVAYTHTVPNRLWAHWTEQ